MKTLLIFVFFILPSFLISVYAQSGWQKQTANTTKTLIDVYFIDNNTGWIVGDSAIILKTTNSGVNWLKSTYYGNVLLVSVYFKNQNTGLVGGYISGQHLNGFVIKSTNGGNTWSETYVQGEPYCLFSFGGDTVWSSRHDGNVMKSTNMGNTWTPAFVHTQLELYSVFFINNLTGWTGGAVYQGLAYIYKTTDGGNTWFNQFISATHHFYSIHFLNQNTGFAATLFGAIYGTTNGGTDWLTLLPGNNSTLFNLQSVSPGTCYTVGENSRIFKTQDNGANWILQMLPPGTNYNHTFSSIYFRNISLGWVVGSSGIILKTTNGGELIGVQNIGTTIPHEYNLSQNYPNPFNPATTIEFDLPKSSNVSLMVYDIKGKIIEQLVDEYLQAGSYKTTFNANDLSSGIYFYRIAIHSDKITANDFTQTKKLVLVK
ncbi:MAG: T9SS C-terminal target domain-containing protein [Ignavibacteriae bacterium]|nr:MAG: T9SS C-terminal target domain-containing protein [Ignavibacteriota bacterium]